MSRVQDTARILSAVPYFAGVDAPTLDMVARAAIRRDFSAGQLVFLEGDRSAGLYVVERGWLKSLKTSQAGREQILRLFGPGEVFNDISVLVDSPNLATVVALEPATVWLVRRETMIQLLDRQPALARHILENLAGRVLHLVALVEDLSLRSIEARLARVLLEQSAEGVLPRRRWATQAEMASRLGTVPDVLNRALRDLVDRGIIRVERHQIEILDPERLEALVTQAE